MNIDLETELRHQLHSRAARLAVPPAPPRADCDSDPSNATTTNPAAPVPSEVDKRGVLLDLQPERETTHRRRVRAFAFAGLAAASVAGVITLTAVRDQPQPISPVGDPTAPIPTAAAPSTTVSSAPTTTPATIAAPTTVPPSPELSPSAALAALRADRLERLAVLNGFSATVTQTRTFTPGPSSAAVASNTTKTSTVVMFADGRTWIDDGIGGWTSYDPTTGTVRAKFVNLDGTVAYQQIDGQATNSLPVGTWIGVDPALDPFDNPYIIDEVVEDISYDGNPAWHVTFSTAVPPLHADDPDWHSPTFSYTIDKGSGLIVARDIQTITADGTQRQTTSMTDLDYDIAGRRLGPPDEFPGVFPADAAIDQSGTPNLTIDQAAAEFGTGFVDFVLPADAAATSAIITVGIGTGSDEHAALDANGAIVPNVNIFDLTITTTSQWQTTAIHEGKATPIPEQPQAPGQIVTPTGALCESQDGTTCNPTAIGDESIITEGDLAGAPSGPANSRTIDIYNGSTTISIIAPDPTDALFIANHLTSRD